MSEVTDLVMPVLQRMQADLADLKRGQAEHGRVLSDLREKIEDIEIHLGYLTGIESQNRFDLNKPRQRLKAAEGHITTLEPQT